MLLADKLEKAVISPKKSVDNKTSNEDKETTSSAKYRKFY